jgi:Replication factor RFC1 C terminal domain
MRKAKRLIRELKAVMGYNAQATRSELQNEYVDLMLNLVYKELHRGKEAVTGAVEIMEGLGLSNEHLKEHLMGLSMDVKLAKSFDDLDTLVKSAFTREYNKRNASNTAGVVKKVKG